MRARTLACSLVACGMAAAGVPLLAPPAGAAATPAFSGYSISAVATPLEMDVYEPTIPLPAEPQLELELGFSKAVADSGSSRSRASLLWPGAALGEGFKTIADTLHLPPDIGAQGYPVQSNSTYPAGPFTDSKDTVPGAVMRTSAAATVAQAQAGYSGDCDVQGAGASGCPLPSALSVLADVAGSSAIGKVESSTKQVVATSHAAAHDVSLLAGLITVTGLSANAVSTSDGHRTKGSGQATYTGLQLDGQPVRLGPDGAVLPGQTVTIPGLPTDPNAALAQLGITVTVPKPVYDRQGSLLTATDAALVVQVDSGVLRHKLDVLPISTVGEAINQLPDQLGQVKSALGAALYLSPRFVFTLAKVQSAVDTVQGIAIPALPVDLGFQGPVAPVVPKTVQAVPGTPALTPPGAVGPTPTLSESGTLVGAVRPAGLPARFTVPGILLLGAALVAALAGGWLRRLTGLLLGADSRCLHGLHNGLPDLRKA